MSDSSRHWIDEQLRRVPLPEGLLERLRELGQLADDDLDHALASVPLPVELIERLLLITDDELLDAQVREVPVPDDLLEELLFIPHEEQLKDVTVPADLLLDLRRIPPRPRRRLPAMQVALAASLLLMITAGYVLSVTGLMLSAYDRLPHAPEATFSIAERGIDLTSSVDEGEAVAIAVLPERADTDSPDGALVDVLDPLDHTVDTQSVPANIDAWMGPHHELNDSILPMKYGILGHLDNTADRIPRLEMVDGPESRGVAPPVAVGFDRKFLITKRTQPVVSLEAVEKIAAAVPNADVDKLVDAVRHNRLPLWGETTSFDLLRRRSEAPGRSETAKLPSPEEIHVEDFLAAMEYHYHPAKDRELALRVYGGPSVFGEDGAQLLQVGVKAGAAGRRSEPMHVTLAVDVSQSMSWGDRLDMVRKAVAKLSGQLTADDRISLVVFNNEANLLLEDVPGDDREALEGALDWLSPQGATNIGAGLQQAAVAALTASAARLPKRRVVVISDGAPAAPVDIAARMNALLRELADNGVTLDVIDVGSSTDGDAGLEQIAKMAGRGKLSADSADGLHRTLAEQLTGQSPVIAEDAVLRVSFNPKAVRAYRLLGHETTMVGGLFAAPVESTMVAGGSATALYEVWLYPNGDNRVGEVEVSWRDPASGREDVRREEIRFVQFKNSFREAALQLQAATIAAEAAEVLRQSPFAERPRRDLSEVFALADDVNPHLGERGSFQRYLRVLRQADGRIER